MKFERKILLAFLFAILAVGVLVFVAARTAGRLTEDNRLAGIAASQRFAIVTMVGNAFEAEAVARAYAFTGLPIYREEFDLSLSKLADDQVRIGALSFSDDAQTERVRQLRAAVRERVELLQILVAERDELGMEAARAHVASGKGKLAMDRVRALSTAVAQSQTSRIEAIHEKARQSARKMFWVLCGFAVVNFAILGVSFFLMWREWSRGGGYVARLQEAAREMELLSSMSSGLQSCGGVEEAKELMQHFLEKLFPRRSGALYVIRASRNVLEVKAGWGDTIGWSPIMEPQDCWALRLGRVQEFREGSNTLPCAHVSEARGGYLCVPMMAEGEALGVLHLRDPADETNGESGEGHANRSARAERIAAQFGPLIASLTLREQFRQQSIRDGLTGLYNRRYLEETMHRELLRAGRAGTSVAVIMMDVDHFKKLNDMHGHQAGDEVLQKFAIFLRDGVRGEDIACRFGGEEFAVVLPGVGLDMALQRAERMRSELANLRLRLMGQALPPMTASFGVAVYPGHGGDWEALLRAADGALYSAKRSGRNRVVGAGGADPL